MFAMIVSCASGAEMLMTIVDYDVPRGWLKDLKPPREFRVILGRVSVMKSWSFIMCCEDEKGMYGKVSVTHI